MTDIVLSRELKAFPLKSVRKTCQFSLHIYKRVLEVLSKANTKERNKMATNRAQSQSLSIYDLYDSKQ